MPVPTETLRNMRVLNAVFAVSSVLLLLSTVWLVLADYNRPWRIHQREAIRWDAAMTRGVLEGEEIKAARGQIEAITAELAELEQQVASEQGDIQMSDLAVGDLVFRSSILYFDQNVKY